MPSTPLSPSEQLTQKARAALDLGRPSEAVRLLLQALNGADTVSEAAFIMERLSYALQQTGEKEEALFWAERAIVRSPEWCWAHLRRAGVLEELGRVNEAIADVCMARALSPELPWVYQKLACLYLSKNAFERAEVNAAQFQKLAPDNADAYYYLANIALNAADAEKDKARREALLVQAEQHLQNGLALNPESPFLHRLMGHLRREQKRHPEALPYYLEAARGLTTSPSEQNNVEATLRTITLRGQPLNTRQIRIGAACCLLQVVASFGFHWRAWAAYGAAVFLAVAVEVTINGFAPYLLYLYAPLRQLNPNAKKILFDVARRERRIWFKYPLTGLLDVLFLNLPPLLLRGLWNAGVWAFHFWKLG